MSNVRGYKHAPVIGVPMFPISNEEKEFNNEKYANSEIIPTAKEHHGIHHSLSKCYTNSDLTANHVDKTGLGKQLLFGATARVILAERGVKENNCDRVTMSRRIQLTVSVPDKARASVEYAPCEMYINPATSIADANNMGTWGTKSIEIDFNNLGSNGNIAQFTLAAQQLAFTYVEQHILPNLGIMPATNLFPAVQVSAVTDALTSGDTVLMSPMLFERHSNGTLSQIYHALEGQDIYNLAGVPNTCGVKNVVQPIPACTFNLQEFWQAYNIIEYSACGNGSKSQFESDFLLIIAQNFGLHGNTLCGGIYRNLINKLPFLENKGIVTSPYGHDTIDCVDRTALQIIGAAVTLQTVISRALYEDDLHDNKFILPAGVNNATAERTLLQIKRPLAERLADATKTNYNYWKCILGRKVLNKDGGRDRHLKVDGLNFLKQFGSHIPSYICDRSASRIGDYQVEKENGDFLTFKGSGGIEQVLTSGETHLLPDLFKPRTFSNGLTFLSQEFSDENYLDRITYQCNLLTGAKRSTPNLQLIDGTVLTPGTRLSNHAHNDNSDLLPAMDNLRTSSASVPFCTFIDIPSIYFDYDFRVTVSKYALISKIAGESTTMKRWQLDAHKHNNRDYILNNNIDDIRACKNENFYRNILHLNTNTLKRTLNKHTLEPSRDTVEDDNIDSELLKYLCERVDRCNNQKKKELRDKARIALDEAKRLQDEYREAQEAKKKATEESMVKQASDDRIRDAASATINDVMESSSDKYKQRLKNMYAQAIIRNDRKGIPTSADIKNAEYAEQIKAREKAAKDRLKQNELNLNAAFAPNSEPTIPVAEQSTFSGGEANGQDSLVTTSLRGVVTTHGSVAKKVACLEACYQYYCAVTMKDALVRVLNAQECDPASKVLYTTGRLLEALHKLACPPDYPSPFMNHDEYNRQIIANTKAGHPGKNKMCDNKNERNDIKFYDPSLSNARLPRSTDDYISSYRSHYISRLNDRMRLLRRDVSACMQDSDPSDINVKLYLSKHYNVKLAALLRLERTITAAIPLVASSGLLSLADQGNVASFTQVNTQIMNNEAIKHMISNSSMLTGGKALSSNLQKSIDDNDLNSMKEGHEILTKFKPSTVKGYVGNSELGLSMDSESHLALLTKIEHGLTSNVLDVVKIIELDGSPIISQPVTLNESSQPTVMGGLMMKHVEMPSPDPMTTSTIASNSSEHGSEGMGSDSNELITIGSKGEQHSDNSVGEPVTVGFNDEVEFSSRD